MPIMTNMMIMPMGQGTTVAAMTMIMIATMTTTTPLPRLKPTPTPTSFWRRHCLGAIVLNGRHEGALQPDTMWHFERVSDYMECYT